MVLEKAKLVFQSSSKSTMAAQKCKKNVGRFFFFHIFEHLLTTNPTNQDSKLF